MSATSSATQIAIADIDPATGEPLPIDAVLIELEGGASQAVIFDRLAYLPL